MTKGEPFCQARVHSDGYYSRTCTRKGVVQRPAQKPKHGRHEAAGWWCKQHDPVRVRESEEAKSAAREIAWARRQASWKRDAAIEKATEGVLLAVRLLYEGGGEVSDVLNAFEKLVEAEKPVEVKG